MRGDGRLFHHQGSSLFWAAYWAPENSKWREIRESTHTADRKVAEKYLRARVQEIANHRRGLRRFSAPAQEKVTVGQLLDNLTRYLQVHRPKSYGPARAQIKRVRDYFGDFRAHAVTAEDVREFIAKRLAEEAKPSTINRAVEKLARAYHLGIKDGRISFAPSFESLPEENARQGFMPKAEFEKLISKVSSADYADLFCWLYWTGMRPGAATAFTWEAFDRQTWTLYLAAKDDKIGRGIPWELTGEFRKIIERRLQRRRLDSPFIFHRDGKRIDAHYMRAWTEAETAAELPHRLVYDLRRTALRNNVRAGIPERVCMAISGHRTRAVFDRYNIVSGEDLREAAMKRAGYEAALAKDGQ
jgi:integrase